MAEHALEHIAFVKSSMLLQTSAFIKAFTALVTLIFLLLTNWSNVTLFMEFTRGVRYKALVTKLTFVWFDNFLTRVELFVL